jgi:multidrug efflux system outer membrane protein
MNRYKSILLALVLTLCSCALREPSNTHPIPRKEIIVPTWLTSFTDSLIPILAPQAIEHNQDLAIAAARLREGRALAREARSRLWPDLALIGQGYRGNDLQGSPFISNSGTIGADLNWEIDFFGATTARSRSALNSVNALTFSAEHLQLLVLADLLTAIVEWRQAHTNIREVTRLIATQQDQVELIRSRVNAGLLDAANLERAEAQRLQTASRLPLARALAETSQYRIEVLTGQLPHSLSQVLSLNSKQDLQAPKLNSILELPVSTLRDRPDIRAAFETFAASEQELRAAEADLWPRVTFGAFFGARDVSVDIPLASNPIWSLAPSISLPIFNFNRLRSRVAAADARKQAALARYEQTVIRAAQEIESALSTFRHGSEALLILQRSQDRRRETVTVLTERFRRGLIDMVSLTTAQAELDQATLAVIEQTAAVNIAAITAHRAVVSTNEQELPADGPAPSATAPAPMIVEAEKLPN